MFVDSNQLSLSSKDIQEDNIDLEQIDVVNII